MKSIQDVMKEINASEVTLIRKTLIFVSPLTGEYEYRVAYFAETMDADVWEQEMEQDYGEGMQIPHHIYTDVMKGVLHHA